MPLLILFVCLLCLPLTSGGVSKIHDELIWQKEGPSYSSFKLDFPWKFFKTRENRVIQTLASLEDSIASSLNGPTTANLTQLAHSHSDTNLPPSSFEIKLLTNDVPLEAASLVARCKVCMALASNIWSAGVEFIHHYLRPPTMEEIMSYSENICEVEVPVTILKDWLLLKAKIAQPQGSSGGSRLKKGDSNSSSKGTMWSDFFLMSQRHRQHATSREIQVIEYTCENRLVTEHEEPSVLLTTVEMLLQRYHSHLMQWIDGPAVVAYKQELAEKKKHLRILLQQQQEVVEGEMEVEIEEKTESQQEQDKDGNNDDAIHNTPSSSNVEDSSNVIDDYVDPPSLFLDRSCTDIHPQCEYWAKYGECSANPKYMVGSPIGGAGHCKKACKTCTPKTRANAVEQGKLLKEATNMTQLESVSNNLLIELYNKACVQTDSCAWATGDGQHSLLTGNPHFSGSNNNNIDGNSDDGNKADFMLQTPFIRRASPGAPDSTSLQGEDSSTTSTTTKDLSQVLKLTKVTVTRPITEAVLSESRSLGVHSSPPEHIADTNYAGQMLWYALGNKCIYVSTGWWVYEMCGWRGVIQFHLSDTKEADWVILIGKWKATVWEVEVKRDSVFYPEGSEVPCITQYLEDGNECELDGEEEEGVVEEKEGGGGRTMIRRSGVVHLMCSPDESMHMVVKEPRKCFYSVEVALPELCKAGGLQLQGERGGGRAEEEDGEIGGYGEVRDEL